MMAEETVCGDVTASAQLIERKYWEMVLGRVVGPGCPLPTFALPELSIMPGYSEVHPNDVNLGTTLGCVSLKIPFLSAPMGDVTGAEMAIALSGHGGCGIIYRCQRVQDQIGSVKEALRRRPFLVENPKSLRPDDTVREAQRILDEFGFSTIPVITETGSFEGIMFTNRVSFKEHGDDLVSVWMESVSELKTVRADTPFSEVQHRLRNEQECSILPVLNEDGSLAGFYFMKDTADANPVTYEGNPLVGMAINDREEDINERVIPCLDLGVGIVVIDSSHGNCRAVIEQVTRLKKVIGNRKVCIIAGNVADIDGYLRLSAAGADVVKLGIGPGSICTTSIGTGIGYPMFTLIQKISFARRYSKKIAGVITAGIVADGSINTPGDVVKALAAGADAIMGGKMFVAASESVSFSVNGTLEGMVSYSGEASEKAIRARSAENRYGKGKRAAEGVSGSVKHLGPLRKWFPKVLELVCGGLAHTGSHTISELQSYCLEKIGAWAILTPAGREQNAPRV